MIKKIQILRSRLCVRHFSNKTKDGVIFNPSAKDESILEITLPSEMYSSYSFSNLDRLPLYENFSNTKYYQNFIPLPKTNILILSTFTLLSYSTPYFQPALLLTLFCLKKYFLTSNFKVLDINSIDLHSNLNTLIVRNYYGTSKIDLSDTQIGQSFTLGKTTYYELINKTVKYPVYINDNGRFINKDLFNEILCGQYESVKFLKK